MTRARTGGRFAGGPAAQAAPLALDVEALVRRVYSGAMRRSPVRRALHAPTRDHQLDKAHSRAYAHGSALATVADQMRRLRRAGATFEELLRFPEGLYEIAFALAGRAPRDLNVLDLEDERLAGQENVMQMQRRVHGLDPARLADEADLRSRQAALSTEAAFACRMLAARQPVPMGACA